MSDFLSNLIARSFKNVPVIQPCLPSLFETAADEFFDDRQSSAPAIDAAETIASPRNAPPVSKSSPMREAVRSQSIAKESDADAKERLRQRDVPAHESAPVIAQTRRASEQKIEVETKKIIVPVDSVRDRKDDAGSAVHPGRRKDFSPVEQRASNSAPIIRVTIGRVEVRAIHPPASTPRHPKPPSPRISLENYLRGDKR
jgi:hypothetical protein